MYISTLCYLAAPDVMSWRYSIIWSRSSQCLMILSGSIHHHVEPFVICWLYGSHIMIWATLCCCCASSLFQNCYTHAMHSHFPVCLRGTLLRCLVRPCIIFMVYSSCFPSRIVIMMTSYCIVVPLVLHSWSPWTLFYSYGVDYTGQWFDNDPMISTTTADHGLYIPDLSTTPIIATRCRGDVLVDVATDVVFLRRSARRRRCRRGADLLCLCASPASCWWISTTPMMGLSSPAPMPSELVKQFVSVRWTLEDDLMILILLCRTWLDLTLYFVMIMVIVSEHPVRLSVCHPVRCCTADVVFNQHFSCL